MPVTPTYPGVYVQEIPSGVRAIAGVATSVTAFLGRTARGPVNTPVTITSFGDFERAFGGLWAEGPLTYAVRDFFTNGGGQAIVVRLYAGDGDAGAATLTLGSLRLAAASPGAWGNGISATTDREGIDDEVAERFGLDADDLFNLTVRAGGVTERFANLTFADSPRRVDRALRQGSQLVRVPEDFSFTGLTGTPTSESGAPVAATGGADSRRLSAANYLGSRAEKSGLFALERADLFNLLCIPPDARGGDVPPSVLQQALAYCVERRALLIVDPPAAWASAADPLDATDGLAGLGLTGPAARNAAIFFPRVIQSDPLREGQLDVFAPCGAVAGVMARTDAQRGVWKAPAGIEAAISGVQGLSVSLTDAENGQLNPRGINCLRTFPAVGRVLWGARTLRGADQLADEYKYIPVRRLALYIEESLYRGMQWAVFEPNDESLWAQIRLNVGAFMNGLFRQGAFQGQAPRDAYFVKCDRETTTQSDINLGVVNVVVGFAPLKPAEFVIIGLQQMAGQVAA